MFIVYGLLLCSWLVNNLILQLAFILFWSMVMVYKSERVGMFLILSTVMLLSSHAFPDESSYCGRVRAIYETNYRLETLTQTYRIEGVYTGNIDDTLCVSGEREALDGIRGRMKYRVKKAQIDSIKPNSGMSARLWQLSHDYPVLKTIFWQDIDDSSQLNPSLAMQLSGLLKNITFLILPYVGHEVVRLSRLGVGAIYTYLFGFKMSSVRIVLKDCLSKKQQIIILMIFFPRYTLSAGFIIPFAPYLLSNLAARIKTQRFGISQTLTTLLCMHRYNIVSHLIYPITRMIYGLLIPFALIYRVLPQCLDVLIMVIGAIESMNDNPLMKRLTLVGRPSLLLCIIIMVLGYRQQTKHQFYLFLVTLLLMIYPPYAQTTFIDVGQGDATLIQAPFNAYVTLIDTGRKSASYNLKHVLNQKGVSRINQLIITHPDLDHNENQTMITEAYNPTVITDKAQSLELINPLLNDVMYEADSNENSIITMSLNGVIVTGDATIDQERAIMEKYHTLNTPYLKLGHHGSQTSSDRDFLKFIQPRYAIISSKPSTYGHPHKRVMRDLYDLGIRPLQTSIHGNISIIHGINRDVIHTSSGMFDIIKPVIRCLK